MNKRCFIVTSETGLWLTCDAMRGTKHKYITVPLDGILQPEPITALREAIERMSKRVEDSLNENRASQHT